MRNYGTLQLLDELRAEDNDLIYDYGEDRLYDHLRDLLNLHNRLTSDIMGIFSSTTTTRISRFGVDSVGGEMVEVDEFGIADVQKTGVTGYDIGLPLRAFQFNLGWTRRYMETKSVGDWAAQVVNMLDADVKGIKREALKALTRATNYTWNDHLEDFTDLPVKALQNADGSPIPMDQWGNEFDGATHTHLVGRAGGSFAASDVTALINNVQEHGGEGGQVMVFINEAQLPAMQAFTSNFAGFQAPLADPGPGSTADIIAGGRKDNPYQTNDKVVGTWNDYVWVWVKPWVPAGYVIAFLTDDINRGKILRMRMPEGAAGRGRLRVIGEHQHGQLRAQFSEREFGFGVWNRLGAAVLLTSSGTYTAPTIT